MMNNFELIKSKLEFKNPDDFYAIQILRRGKDHPDLPATNRLIKTYCIRRTTDLDRYRDEIIGLCDFFKARAYIRISALSMRHAMCQTSARLIKCITDEDYSSNPERIAYSGINSANVSGQRLWIVDVDTQNEGFVEFVQACVESCMDKIYHSMIYRIPSNSGWHIVTPKFNTGEFNSYDFECIGGERPEIKKEGLTLLYCPEV